MDRNGAHFSCCFNTGHTIGSVPGPKRTKNIADYIGYILLQWCWFYAYRGEVSRFLLLTDSNARQSLNFLCRWEFLVRLIVTRLFLCFSVGACHWQNWRHRVNITSRSIFYSFIWTDCPGGRKKKTVRERGSEGERSRSNICANLSLSSSSNMTKRFHFIATQNGWRTPPRTHWASRWFSAWINRIVPIWNRAWTISPFGSFMMANRWSKVFSWMTKPRFFQRHWFSPATSIPLKTFFGIRSVSPFRSLFSVRTSRDRSTNRWCSNLSLSLHWSDYSQRSSTWKMPWKCICTSYLVNGSYCDWLPIVSMLIFGILSFVKPRWRFPRQHRSHRSIWRSSINDWKRSPCWTCTPIVRRYRL